MYLCGARVLIFVVSSLIVGCLGFHNGNSLLYINSRALFRPRPISTRATSSDTGSVDLTNLVPCKELYRLFHNGLIPFYGRQLQPEPNIPIVVSCSGGVDSMALLHAFGLIKSNAQAFISANRLNCIDGANPPERVARIHQTLGVIFGNVHVLYLDHAMRDDTDKDIEVVKDACDLYGFNFQTRKRDPEDKEYESCKEGFQSWARVWRRKMIKELIEEIAKTTTANKPNKFDASLENLGFKDNLIGIVFMGHHANDNLETMVLKLVRGVNILNFSGISSCTILDENSDNIALLRPFINVPKLKLQEFMQQLDFKHHEDSSNASFDYKRNYVRSKLVPNMTKMIFLNDDTDRNQAASIEVLNRKFQDISQQVQMLKANTLFQLAMFKAYLHSKYGNICWGSPCKDAQVPRHTVDSYIDLYSRLHNAKHRGIHKPTGLRSLGHFAKINLPVENVFLVDEWLTLETRHLRREALWDFLKLDASQELTQRKLVAIADKLEATPNSEKVKLYQLHNNLWLKHQGFFLKVSKHTRAEQIQEPQQVFNDSTCTFRVFDRLQTSIKEVPSEIANSNPGPFALRLWVPYEANGASIEFDIRLARPEDVVPSKMLWNRQLSSLLTAMQIKHIFHEDIPVVALPNSNKVICLYGLNINTPYYPHSRQNATYSFANDMQVTNSCKCFEIRAWR